MPFSDQLEKLYARRRFGIKPGVDRVAKLLELLGNPEKQFRTIHVVGTNGKGSTSTFLSSILSVSGYKVAQFSSPHLVRFSERFKINGKEYSSEKFSTILDKVLKAAPVDATFFEITTALAAYIFCDEGVELAVMEAGMGGHSDATAVFNGEMTIITPISLDHMAYLGATVQDIAREKAGIIKPETVVITASQPDIVQHEIESICKERNSRLQIYGKDFFAEWNSDSTLNYKGLSRNFAQLKLGIAGRFQSINASLALAAAEELVRSGLNIEQSSFIEGVNSAYWPGRMELISGTPRLLLDGAHNPGGSSALADALKDYTYSRLLLVTGVCDDKDFEQIYKPLIPIADMIYTVTPAIERALKSDKLRQFFSNMGVVAEECSSVIDGISRARAFASENDLILVCGSLFVVGEVKAWLEKVPYNGIRG